MKIIIAAAGKGTRMLNLSQDKPKHLIPINGRPWMAHVFDHIASAGLKDIVLVVGHQAHAWDEFLSHDTHGFNVTVVNQFTVCGTERYGTAMPIEAVKNVVDNEQFIFFYGDNVYAHDDIRKFCIDDDYSYIGGMHHDEPERFGVLFEQDGMLKKIVEKPQEYIGNLINVGIYKFTSDIFDAVKLIQKSTRGEYELTDAVTLLAQQQKVKVLELSNHWMDFGRPEDVEKGAVLFKETAEKD